ncbi:MAG: zinc ribbon domain-containing protein [Candidatus Atabeyarchaeum deiterrae]
MHKGKEEKEAEDFESEMAIISELGVPRPVKCPKCESSKSEMEVVTVAGQSRALLATGREFNIIICVTCKYTEFYWVP